MLSLALLLGGQQDSIPHTPRIPLAFPEYANSAFIEIKGNLNEHPEYIWQNHDLFIRAGDRLERHLYVRKGRFVWNISRGRDIKVSQNLYEWFVYGWVYDNRMLATGRFKIKTEFGRKGIVPKRKYNAKGEQVYGKERKKKNKYYRTRSKQQ